MKDRLIDRLPFAKIVVVLAIVFGVAVGLCGLNLALTTSGAFNSGGQFATTILIGSGMLEVGVMLLSGVGLLLTVVVWVFASAVGGASKDDLEPQKLFVEKDDQDRST
jgi:hypothetical protein